MKLTRTLSTVALLASFAAPLAMTAQTSHAQAKAEVEARDKHHHNKAKIVGSSAAGGAAIGAVAGGPVGALVGAGVGAGAGRGGQQGTQAPLDQKAPEGPAVELSCYFGGTG